MNETKIKTAILEKIKNCKTPLWSVILLNDDVTTMDFVVQILTQIFHKNTEEAVNLMLRVHREGKAIVGVYSYEIARAKVALTHNLASQQCFPLRAIMEEC